MVPPRTSKRADSSCNCVRNFIDCNLWCCRTDGKVFSLPGMGSTIADSALSQDAPVVLGLAIVVIAFGAFVNLIVDLSYALIDPRIKIDAKAVH